MNTGGSGWGVNNVAHGSANSVNVFGRGLSEMTLGEVMELQSQGIDYLQQVDTNLYQTLFVKLLNS